ncbi:hypothetical protein lerEdw1_012059 [Lerista edwardsae]|nr:hypothetical protein lerEdw1_012059 [Lerista edwardsae]
MRRQSACRHRQPQRELLLPPPPPPAGSSQGGCDTCHPSHRQQRSSSGARWGLLLFLLLASWIDDVCSVYLARDIQPQSSSALEELCFMVLGLLQKMQVSDKKENTKRFLFHYSKTHDTGNSNTLGLLEIFVS